MYNMFKKLCPDQPFTLMNAEIKKDFVQKILIKPEALIPLEEITPIGRKTKRIRKIWQKSEELLLKLLTLSGCSRPQILLNFDKNAHFV